MGAPVTLRPVQGKRLMTEFLRVPFRVQGQDPTWIPPLFLERRQALDPRRQPYFQHAEAAFWLAERDGRAIGRISAQVDSLAPAGEGHFGLLSAPDDGAVVSALLSAAEDWLRARGCQRVVGPFNLSINQECGLLVDGFDTPPMMLMPHDPPHLGGHLERAAYNKAKDLQAYICDSAGNLPPEVNAMLARGGGERLRLRPIDMGRYGEEISLLADIFNDAWQRNWGFVPFTEAEIKAMATELRPLVDPRLVWFVEWDGDPIAFGVCLPNLNEAIRDLGGRLLPFGWAKLLWRIKVSGVTTGRVPLMGVRRSASTGLAGRLAPFLIIDSIRREARRKGMTRVELSWILEDNLPVIRLIETVGGRRYKTYRLYGKDL